MTTVPLHIEGRFPLSAFDDAADDDDMTAAIGNLVRVFANGEVGVGMTLDRDEGTLRLTLHHVPADHPDIRLPKEPTP